MKKWILTITVAVMTLTACIPLKQFEELNTRAEQLEQEAGMLRSENQELKVDNNELKSKLNRLQQQVEGLLKDTTALSRKLASEQYKYADLNKSYSEALARLKNASGNDGQNKDLLVFLQKLQEDLQAREDALLKAERELNARKKELTTQNQRLLELEQALKQKDNALLALRKSIADALTGFSSDELKVHMKDGKVYVSLEEKLLFKSGSYEVNTQGSNALIKIAKVLENNKNIEIIVEGHTDKVPYKSTVLLDNWDLSVKRATSVVRILLDNSSIEPSRVSAAGRSAYLPVKSGSDAASLQSNRRTEIILTPKMDQIMDLLESR